MKKRIGIIGVGEISKWHVSALREAGFEISAVASRPESTRVEAFAEQYDIPNKYSDWYKLIRDSESWDGLLIATRTTGTLEILQAALKKGKPILVEKPVSHSSNEIFHSIPKQEEKVLVGYNRRFYKPVQKAKEFIQNGKNVIATMNLPDSVEISPNNKTKLYQYYDNSSHGIDLLYYLFDGLSLINVNHLKYEPKILAGFTAVLRSDRGDIIHLIGNWGIATNFSLSIDREGERFELKPFEIGTYYDEMKVIPPSDDYPIRQYTPNKARIINLEKIDFKEKPGFVQQAQEFKRLFEEENLKVGATLDDAYQVMKLCEVFISGAKDYN